MRRLGRQAMLAAQPVLAHTGLTRRVWRALEGLRAAGADDEGAAIGPDGIPVPPARLRVGVVNSTDVELFLEYGALTATAIRDAAEEHGPPMSEVGRLLDFGCGCGRVTRYWSAIPDLEVHGSDLSAEAVEWLTHNLPFVQANRNDLAPPLPYADETFGLVYAISVFTHLTEDLGIAWMRELHRITRPGGLVLFSVSGRAVAHHMTRRERAEFDQGKLVVQFEEAAGANICNAFHPEAYVRGLAREFEVLQFVPTAENAFGPQDFWIVRRPLTDRSAPAGARELGLAPEVRTS
jgi:SAM-dependent methyltransferase